MIRLTEAPRDAVQGIQTFIPTQEKVEYLHKLLQVGFDMIDCCSFVSKKAVPQMQDSLSVVKEITQSHLLLRSKLLAIVVNTQGAELASQQSSISYMGFPLSLSETFQQRNTRQSLQEAFGTVKKIHILCQKTQKKLRVFLSMGFGNPYGDQYNEKILLNNIEHLQNIGIKDISVADTLGSAQPMQIERTFLAIERHFPKYNIGAHLHASPAETRDKIAAAYQGGCKSFDAAIKGYGGCPMAANKLVGNVATEVLIEYLHSQKEPLSIDTQALTQAQQHCVKLFSKYTT